MQALVACGAAYIVMHIPMRNGSPERRSTRFFFAPLGFIEGILDEWALCLILDEPFYYLFNGKGEERVHSRLAHLDRRGSCVRRIKFKVHATASNGNWQVPSCKILFISS